jgi:uncharacterized membrane-anchored protein
MNKVAQISILFWLMKIVATTLGETLGDFLSMTLHLGYSISLAYTFMFFLILLITQINSNKFSPALYWLVIISTTTLGTEISDYIDRSLGWGYTLGSMFLLVLLLSTLYLWKKEVGNLSVYPITKKKTELFYWIAILFSNSLGTAFGDYLSDVLNLPYIIGAAVTMGIILIVLLLHYKTKINTILLFWIAFIFTRPFGATFGDLLTKPVADGGLDLGTMNASIVSITIMLLFIIYIRIKKEPNEKAQ